MSKMKELDEIAEGVAEVTLELMADTVDWQVRTIAIVNDEVGEDYNKICKHILDLAITKMFDGLRQRGQVGGLPGIGDNNTNTIKLATDTINDHVIAGNQVWFGILKFVKF